MGLGVLRFVRVLVVAALIALGSPPLLRAQVRVSHGDSTSVPAGQRPPAGMCRVWLNGVPARNQPAPTSCANAVKVHASNSHVIFGATPSGTGPAQPVRVAHVMTAPPNAIASPGVQAQAPPPPSARVTVVKPPKPLSPPPPPPPSKPPRLSTHHR